MDLRRPPTLPVTSVGVDDGFSLAAERENYSKFKNNSVYILVEEEKRELFHISYPFYLKMRR
jgi:hypothetical protein